MIEKKAKQLHQYMNKTLPKQIRDMGLHFFISRFREQGWRDKNFEPWEKRKKNDKRKGRAILIDRGRLRNSIRADIKGESIIFGTDVPYAKVHNEGGLVNRKGGMRIVAHKKYTRGKHAGRTLFHKNNKQATFAKKVEIKASSFNMPKRQFIGESAHLNKVITKKIENSIKQIFKS